MRKKRWPLPWHVWVVAVLLAGVISTFVFLALPRPTVVPSQATMPAGTARQQRLTIPLRALPEPDERISLLFTGDIMLGRYVETLRRQYGDAYPFEKISSDLTRFNTIVGNLEGPILADHRQTPDDSLRFSFSSSAAALLARQGIMVAGIANNHGLDGGVAGVDQTKAFLLEAGVQPLGNPAGLDASSVIAFKGGNSDIVLVACSDLGGRCPREPLLGLLTEQGSDSSHFVVLFVHWGDEYQTTSSRSQQELAHAAIDAGADLVVGHHPHVIQELEEYQDRLIVYSLGNFIFDQYFSEETQRGLLLQMTLKSASVEYTLLPIESEHSQPELMRGDALVAFLNKLALRSDDDLREGVQQGTIMMVR